MIVTQKLIKKSSAGLGKFWFSLSQWKSQLAQEASRYLALADPLVWLSRSETEETPYRFLQVLTGNKQPRQLYF